MYAIHDVHDNELGTLFSFNLYSEENIDFLFGFFPCHRFLTMFMQSQQEKTSNYSNAWASTNQCCGEKSGRKRKSGVTVMTSVSNSSFRECFHVEVKIGICVQNVRRADI